MGDEGIRKRSAMQLASVITNLIFPLQFQLSASGGEDGMAFRALRFQQYVFHAFVVSILFASQAMATPKPMKEWELGGVEAGTGVNLHFDNVSIENKKRLHAVCP